MTCPACGFLLADLRWLQASQDLLVLVGDCDRCRDALQVPGHERVLAGCACQDAAGTPLPACPGWLD